MQRTDAPKKVLVVEDDLDCVEAIAEALEGDGYVVAKAHNGAEALLYFENQDPPNLVLLDLMMPHMDGWEFVGEYRKKKGRLAPIVILSGEQRLIRIASELGVAGYLRKPVDVDTLLATVARLAS